MQTGDGIVEDEGKPYNIRYRCFHFAKDVINLVKEVEWERAFGSMFDQLVRSSTSIGANIIEGSAGSSKKDWLRFLNIALKSSNETKYRLCLIN